MKYVFLVVALVAIIPFADWIRRNPGKSGLIWTIFGLLPFVLNAVTPKLYVGIISWEWPGPVKGIEFSAIDAMAIAIYLTLPRSSHPLPFRLAMGLYFFAVVFSTIFSVSPVTSVFYAWQLARMLLIYAVVTRACTDERVTRAIINGMVIGVCIQCCYVVVQRFGQGMIQASGTFGHQNSLGMATYFAIIPAFALLLSGKRGWQLYAVLVAGLLIGISTASRATIGLMGFGLGTVFLLSAARQWTSRKATYAMLGVVSMIVVIPLVLSSLENRFGDSSFLESQDDRAAYEIAARMMVSDYPLGVGANNFVIVANGGDYYERAGVSYTLSRQSSVHNAYWLAAAETGVLGFVTLAFLMLQPLVVAFRCGWRNRRDPRGDLLLGLGVALLTLYLHSFYEWVFFTFQIQYFFAIASGMVAGTAIQLGYWRPMEARNAQLGVNQLAGQRLK